MNHRVLFFVEPYCVRSGPDDFRTPFEIFRRIACGIALHPDVECGIVCSSHFASDLPHDLPAYTPARYGIDESPDADWETAWPRMLRGEDHAPWGAYFANVIRDFRPTLVFTWNKNSLFTAACRAAWVGTVTLEYGSIRTPSGFRISVDPRGFGPESALATSDFPPVPAAARNGWTWAATHVLSDALAMHKPMPKGTSRSQLHAAVLLQKEDDVNFLVWPAFESMWRFIEHTLDGLSHENDVQVTVRPHPAGLESYDERISKRFPAVTVDRRGTSFYEELLNYDCVLTLNSAAGLEALLCRRPAMTFASAAYPVAFDARRDGDVRDFIRLVRERTFWTPERVERVGAFAWRLVTHYSIPQELMVEPSLYLRMVEAWSGRAPVELEAWFEESPARLAALVRECREALTDTQLSALRYQNSLRVRGANELARQIEALSGVLAEMTRRNELRDEAISAATTELHRQSQLLAELLRRGDESGAQIHALLEQVHLQSQMFAEIWAMLRPATAQK